MAVTYLATKSANPVQEDYNKLLRVLSYVMTTRTRKLFFRSNANLKVQIFADAAHMLHKDSKGHGGIITTLGSSPVLTKSFKFKLVTEQ
jgi:hypothetical protein